DLRGRVGETLGEEDALALGRAVAAVARAEERSRLAVAYDGRLSSPALERALVEGLARSGICVTRLGRGPTPLLYYSIQELGLDGGIMVTGSHNPPDENGFKIVLGSEPFQGARIAALGRIAEAGAFIDGIGRVEEADLRRRYASALAAELRGERGLSVAWDCGNGATGEVLGAILRELPGRHLLLNAEIDGRFPAHHPDPTVPRNLEQLQEAVREHGLDLGIAFDGDGDRIGLVDGGGFILWADQLMILLAEAILKDRPGAPIVADVKASQTLFDAIAAAGGRPILSPSGYTLIRSRMLAERAPLAGEMSGHIFFNDGWTGYDDALYVAMRTLKVLARSGESLAAFRKRLPAVVSTPELRIPCPDGSKAAVVSAIAERLRREGRELDETDGVRVREGGGWWLLRASNTQPVLAGRCEADSIEGLARLREQLAALLREHGLDLPEG
ncbi:MAG TPA: phosphomannomutase/phosphoglucomutase, partial [Alphaproteobacteria bacterium]